MNPNTTGAIISIVAGTITVCGAIAVILSTANFRLPRKSKEKQAEDADPKHIFLSDIPIDEDAVRWSIWWAHRGMVLFYLIIGMTLLIAPHWVFGSTWFYFKGIPHGGAGMGVACIGLVLAMIFAIWRRSKFLVSSVLFAGGITFWIAAFLVAAEGVSAHSECIEALFMMYAAVDMLIRAAVIRR